MSLMRRIVLFLQLILVLVFMPGFCAAGELQHPCADSNSSDCGHERECLSDPCQPALVIADECSLVARSLPLLTIYPPTPFADLQGLHILWLARNFLSPLSPEARESASLSSASFPIRDYDSSGLPLLI